MHSIDMSARAGAISTALPTAMPMRERGERGAIMPRSPGNRGEPAGVAGERGLGVRGPPGVGEAVASLHTFGHYERVLDLTATTFPWLTCEVRAHVLPSLVDRRA